MLYDKTKYCRYEKKEKKKKSKIKQKQEQDRNIIWV